MRVLLATWMLRRKKSALLAWRANASEMRLLRRALGFFSRRCLSDCFQRFREYLGECRYIRAARILCEQLMVRPHNKDSMEQHFQQVCTITLTRVNLRLPQVHILFSA